MQNEIHSYLPNKLNPASIVNGISSLEVIDTPNAQAFQSKVTLRNLRVGGNRNLSKFNKSRVLQLGWNNSMHQYRLSSSLAEMTWVLLWPHWRWANSTCLFLQIKPSVYWAIWERGLPAGGGKLLAPSAGHWWDYTWNTEPFAGSPLFRGGVEKRA